MTVLAYHIIWTTYGTWLPGDSRGWIRKNVAGVLKRDPEREQHARECMAEEAVLLTPWQRALVEKTIRDHCRIRKWSLHAVNVRSNHTHLVVTADHEAGDVTAQLKAWCSRKLSDAASLEKAVAVGSGRRRWFTEGGDKIMIDNESYLQSAIRYVVDGQ